MKAFALAMALSLSACAQPVRHHYPPRTKCPALPTLPDPATVEDKDAWIAAAAKQYGECAASRRVFIRGEGK